MRAVQSSTNAAGHRNADRGRRAGNAPRPPASRRAPGRSSPARHDQRSGQSHGSADRHRSRRLPPAVLSFGVIGLVVVSVVVLVVVKLTASAPATGGATDRSPAPAALVAQLSGVPGSVFAAVGTPGSLTVPHVVTGQSPLAYGAKPGVLYIGGEFCPYCAADRWPIVVALSRFGNFSNLAVVNSSPWDTDPSTASLSFFGATYTSDYVAFRGYEEMGNDTTGPGTHRVLAPLDTPTSRLWAGSSAKLGTSQGFPFLDIGNKVFALGPSFDPAVLSGLDQAAIGRRLANPDDPVTRAIVGSANLYTAALCSVTGSRPAPVCNAPATTEAARALGLS
ncbi:MAG: DUF929 family protein [Acidimicrobiales bacterium]